MPESEEELKSLLQSVKEECEKAGLNLNIEKTKIIASSPITSWEIDEGKVTDLFWLVPNRKRSTSRLCIVTLLI